MKCADLHKSLGERIRTIRKSKRITQERLAELADLNLSYMSEIERGLANVSLSVVASIANALGISLVELFVGVPRNNVNDEIQGLLEQVQNLDEKQIRIFIKSAKGIISGIQDA